MPTIPQYNVGQVRNADLPANAMSANASAASFGGNEAEGLSALSQGLGRAGYTAGNIAVNIQERDNEDVVRGQMNTARAEMNQFAQEQYSLKGSDAFGASTRIKEHAEKVQAKYEQSLGNDVQKRTFSNVFGSYAGEHLLRSQNFERDQMDAYHQQTLNQSVDRSVEEIQMHMNDPDFVTGRLGEIAADTRRLNSGRGDIDEKVKLAIQGTLLKAISEKSATDPVGALTFLETHIGNLGKGEHIITLQKRLQGQVKDLRNADIIMRETAAPGATLETVIASIDKQNLPPDEKEKALAGARAQMSIRTEAQAQSERKATEGGWNQFYTAPSAATIATLPISPEEKQKMTEKLTVMTKIKTDAEYAGKYGEVLRMSKKDFLEKNLFEIRYDVSPQQYQNLVKDQDELRKTGKEKTPGFAAAIKDATTEAGKLEPFHIGETDSQEVIVKKQDALNQFVSAYSSRLEAIPDAQRNDWKVKQDIRNELLKEVVINHRSPLSWLNGAIDGVPFGSDEKAARYEIESGAKAGAPVVPATKQTTGFKTREEIKKAYDSGWITEKQGIDEIQSLKKKPAPQAMNDLPPALVDFVKDQEGFAPKAFGDYKQNSIGYGTRARSNGETLTKQEADIRLREELGTHYQRIQQAAAKAKLELSEGQIAALTSFDFNTGHGVDLITTSKSLDEIKDRMAQYTKAGGKHLPGLAARRKSELELFEGMA